MQNSEGICALTQNSCKWDYIFLQRSQTAETASIKLLLKPEASSAATAAMVSSARGADFVFEDTWMLTCFKNHLGGA